MRRVIVDQIEALAELNRIVARHGRGLDATEPPRRAAGARLRHGRRPRRGAAAHGRPAAAHGCPDARRRPAPISPDRASGRAAPRRLAVAQPPGQGNGWLSELLHRASAKPDARTPAANARRATRWSRSNSLSVDIARMIDHDAAAELWDRYKRGERNVFTRRLYTMQGQKTFDEIRKKYRGDREFKQTVDRYIGEFERLLEEVARDDRGQVVARTYLTSETGKVYTMLAHAAGRFGE